MKRLLGICLAIALASGQVFADSNSATLAPSYSVNRASAAPVIDGVVSEGEWAAASAAAGDFVNLRAHTPDGHNLRFQALWDDTNLYILGMSDYDDFLDAIDHGAAIPADPDPEEIFELEDAPNNPDWNGGAYNVNFYIDPNTDDERVWTGTADMDGEPVPGNVVDGYQIAWDVFQGFAARRPTPGNDEQGLRDPLDADGLQVNDYYGGLFLEAHAQSPFGNQGLWDRDNTGPNANYRDDGHEGLVYAQNASNDDLNGTGTSGAVWEWAISWDALNATDPNKLVTQEEADARGPAMIEDTREFLEVPDPEDPEFTIEIDNPDFGMMVENVGQIDGISAFIGEAGEPDLRFSDPDSAVFLDNGLYAGGAPEDGDTWSFEMTAITNDPDNFLPSWSEPLDGDGGRSSFAPWGDTEHGQLIFVGGVTTGCDPESGGDLDGNGTVEFADFLTLSSNFGTEVASHTDGDIDCDGTVGFSDFLTLSANFGQEVGAASSVPEPTGLALLSIAGLALGMVRRRRN